MKHSFSLLKNVRRLRVLAWLPVILLFFSCTIVPVWSADVPVQSSGGPKQSNRRLGLIASLTVQLLAKEHFSGRELDAKLSEQVFDEYLRTLDPSRIFFLKSDVDKFAQEYRDTIAAKAAKGNVDFAFEAFNLRSVRMKEYRDFVHEFLSKPVEYFPDETITADRTEAAWPATQEELHDLWSKRIKNDLITANLADQASAEDAREKETKDKEEGKTGDVVPSAKLRTPEERILKRADNLYTFTDAMESIDVLEAYLCSFAAVFDPHSAYMSPESGKDFDVHLSLNLSGIGAVLSQEDGYTKVVEIVAGGPASKEGHLKENDRLIEVQQDNEEPVNVVDMPLNRVVSMIRGVEGTYVTLTILPARQGAQAAPEKVRIKRGKVPMTESAAKGKIHEFKDADGTVRKIGVIDLPSFYIDFNALRQGDKNYRSSCHDVEAILNDFNKQNIDGLIIDLRSNGGGSLTESIDLTGLFIPDGPVVQVKDRSSIDVLKDQDGGKVLCDKPLLIMINRFSASAAEIFAAALKDYKRAVLVGDPHTHGKGTVQVVTELDRYMLFLAAEKIEAGEIKLTNAKFYRINGESTQLKGVAADIVLPGLTEDEDSGERSLRFSMPWDTIPSSKYVLFKGSGAVTYELIDKLREASEKRISENPIFKALKEDIKLIEEIEKRKEISLYPEKRQQEYRKIVDFQKEQDKLTRSTRSSGSSEKNKDNDGKDDPYLQESLNIMNDMIRLMKAEK